MAARRIFFNWDAEKAELLTVLLLVPLPFLVYSLQAPAITPDLGSYYHDWFYSPWSFASGCLSSIGMGSLVALLVGTRWPKLAERWEKGLTLDAERQAACGVLMFACFVFFSRAWNAGLDAALGIAVPDMDWTSAASPLERFQALVTALVNGPAEELLRVYLIARIYSLTRSGPAAILASAAVFSVYHLYYGWPTVAYFFLVGLFCGWLYFKKNYLLALIVWHVLSDMIAVLYASELHSVMAWFGVTG